MVTDPLRSLERLAGQIDPALLAAPHTAGDPHQPASWPDVATVVVDYLARNVVGSPWGNHLTLATLVLSARRLDVATVLSAAKILHGRFTALFAACAIPSIAEWSLEAHLYPYLHGEVLPEDSANKRANFWKAYRSTTGHVSQWLTGLPPAEQRRFAAYTLPIVDHHQVRQFVRSTANQQAQDQRKRETDAVLPHLAELRAEGHVRYNRLVHLRQAFRDVTAHLEQCPELLPLAFSYDVGGDPERGVTAQERLHFRLWKRRAFVLAHQQHYHPGTVYRAQKGKDFYTPENDRPFVEFVGAERLQGDAPPTAFWFTDLITRGVLGPLAGMGTPDEIAAKQAWLRSWGYGEEDGTTVTRPFWPNLRGLLLSTKSEANFLVYAQRAAAGVIIPIEPLYVAASFGLLALELFTTTGMRVNEALQVSLDDDCLVRTTRAAPPGAKDQTPRTRYVLRLLPKGERGETRHDYFLSHETVRALNAVAAMLVEHYNLDVDAGATLPSVPFNPAEIRAHRFPPARYLFQYQHTHLHRKALVACLRFLMHAFPLRTPDGMPVDLAPHLLRHAFATHLVQVEHIPVDIVGSLLAHKSRRVTTYYSQPTQSLIADAADRFLARVAAHINVDEAVLRSPEQIQRQYEEARGKAGTLTDVEGGQCVTHGYCAAKFACIGCAGKVPDPAKRQQVERKRAWALEQIELALAEGRLPEAERMRWLARECDVELQEMDLIEAYRRDEQQLPIIRLEWV